MALQMTWQQRSLQRRKGGPPLGLKNLGNTCYLNSVLQCLTYTPPLAQFCLSSQHTSLCKSLITNREKECAFCILERQIARSLSLDGPLDAPSKIQKCLTVFAEHFRWGRQEDAHEFLRFVIDACHNTCLKLLKRLSGTANGNCNGAPKAGAEDAGELQGPSSVMKDIFGGALLSQVKCLSCKGESNKTDEIMDISLDLFQSNSLKDALGRFFHPEILEGNNKYNCSKCKKLSVAKKQMFIIRAPNVLVIHLKRFEGIHGGKINRNIEFEEVLLLSKFMYTTSQDVQPEYNLFGSIVHSGYSQESGHYYAYIKDASGRWYCCNDAHVSLSSTQEVLSEKVYILFYLRSNPSPRFSRTGPSCNGKASDANGSEVLPCQKSAELLKPPTVKPNGICPNSNVSNVLKNGKVSSNPQVKSINFKNLETKKVIANGNGNHETHNNAAVEKKGDFERSLVVKKLKLLPEYSSMEESNIVRKVELSSVSMSIPADGSSCDMVEHSTSKTLSVLNGTRCGNLHKTVHEDNTTHSLAAAEKDVDCDLSSSNMVNGNNSGIPASKRKSCDAERAEVSVSCTKGSCSLSQNDVSCKTHWSYQGNHSATELEKFKQIIAADASSDLRSCGWVDRVHSFMRTKKRLCTQATGSGPDTTELRKQLINDAKKTFTYQIPESLKEHLIERLRSFSGGKPLLDA